MSEINTVRSKYLSVASIMWLICALSACGGTSTPPRGINGSWSAQVAYPDLVPVTTFSATLTQSDSGTVTVANFVASPCFSSATVQTATFSPTGTENGYQTGPFSMQISGAGSLTLTGSRATDGNIYGTWIATDTVAACTGHGTFTMNPSSH